MSTHVKMFFLLVFASLGVQLRAEVIDVNIDGYKSRFTTHNIFDDINKSVEVGKKQTPAINQKVQFNFNFSTKENSVNGQEFQINYPPYFKKSSFDATTSTFDIIKPTIFNDISKPSIFDDTYKPSTFDEFNKPVEVMKKETAANNLKGQISFNLFTKKNPVNGQQLHINNRPNFKASYFDITKPTYFITHGWLNSQNSPSCFLIRDAYLANTDSNVIVIDWSAYSASMLYVDVTYRVKEIGGTVSEMISWLYRNGLKSDDVTLIGHSLGAHVMGIAGYKLKQKVKHIVGLDPAIHMYNFVDHGEMLSKQDAKHVQIIHTNGGGSGYMCPNGHSDFFPNGGSFQPGCCDYNTTPSVTNLRQLLQWIVECKSCSHGRAYEFFAESITKRFVATRCPSYLAFQQNACGAKPRTALMGGLHLNAVKPGTYYLRTGSTKPFSKVNGSSVKISSFLASILTTAACKVRSGLN